MKELTLSEVEVELDRICVLRQVQEGIIRGKEAIEQLGVSSRQVRRLLRRLESEGTSGIKRRPSGGNRSFEEVFKSKVMAEVKATYADFGPTLAAEKLEEREKLKVNRETLRQWMIEEGLWKGRTLYGRPVAYYSDRHSIFITTRPNSDNGRFEDTQFHRALGDLGIELICAYSAQAKGRVERVNKVLQDRLIKEMRLSGINNIEEGNTYLPQSIHKHNKRFAVEPSKPQDAHRPLHHSREKLLMILSEQTPRRISKNLEASHNRTIYKIQHPGAGYRLQRAGVLVCECFDGTVTLLHKDQSLPYVTLQPSSRGPIQADRKAIDAIFAQFSQALPQHYF